MQLHGLSLDPPNHRLDGLFHLGQIIRQRNAFLPAKLQHRPGNLAMIHQGTP
jgi:hypothetical protein